MQTQNEVARATIEVELTSLADITGAITFKQDDVWFRVTPEHNAKPLTPAAEAMLNPKNEVAKVSHRIREAVGDDCGWEMTEHDGDVIARAVCRMEAEELAKVLNLVCIDAVMVHFNGTALRERIAELEEMAKEPA